MLKNMILLEIYKAITIAPQILTPEFIEELLDKVLPICESDADDKAVKKAINQLYQNFPEVTDQIGDMFRKSLDSAKPEKNPDYPTVINKDDAIERLKKLEASLKKRLDKN